MYTKIPLDININSQTAAPNTKIPYLQTVNSGSWLTIIAICKVPNLSRFITFHFSRSHMGGNPKIELNSVGNRTMQ